MTGMVFYIAEATQGRNLMWFCVAESMLTLESKVESD